MKIDMLLFVVFVGISVVLATGALSIQNIILQIILTIFSLFFSVVAFSTKYYTYLYLPLFKMKNRTIVLDNKDQFILSPSGNTITLNTDQGIYATAFVKIPIYRSSTEMTDSEKLDFGRTFSRVITLTKETTKMSSEVFVVNKDEYIKKIRDKVDNTSELLRVEQSSQSQNTTKITRLKGELTMWENLMTNISGSKSEGLVSYIMVSAFGNNDEEASSIVYQKADEISGGVSAALGISTYVVEGQELLSLIEPDYMIPLETVNEIIRQKSIKEGI
ncbi:MAG: hypothetical protein ACP5M9_01095 [Candidatus Micrarchaeia archaeon]